MATSNATLTVKQVNNGAREILAKTSALTQVLRQFETLYSTKLDKCDGLTVEAWMSAMGVERFVTPNGAKKGYTPGTIRKGWNKSMMTEEGKMQTFKSVVGKYMEDGKAWPVYTLSEAEKLDGKPCRRYMRVEIADEKWTVALVLAGLKQSRNFKKCEERELTDEFTWEEVGEVAIVKIENGERKVVKISKDDVKF